MGNSVAGRASFKEDVDEYMERRRSLSESKSERKEEFAVVPNITEIRGFVIWIFTIISYFVFILWTLLPRESLIYMGVSYYPSKYVHLFLLFTSHTPKRDTYYQILGTRTTFIHYHHRNPHHRCICRSQSKYGAHMLYNHS